jgi:hypothetical protein
MRIGVLSCALAGVGGTVAAQSRPVPNVLSYPANVRSAALAGAGVAMPGYAGSVFTNASGLAPIRKLSLEATLARLPDHSTYTMGAGAIRVGDFNLGGGYQYLRFPKNGPVYDNLTWVGAAVYRLGGISLGMSGKYVSLEDSARTIARSFTTDLSGTVAFFDIAALALSVQNVGDWAISQGGVELPGSVHLGFSFNLLDTYSNGRLLATVETIWTHGAQRRTAVGLEGGAVFKGIGLVARLGTGGEPGTPITPFSTTTYGGGVVAGRARFDYAYQKRSALGTRVHLFGFRWTP